MEALELVRICFAALSEKKAEEITVIDIREISTIADYFIIASGNNPNQMTAMQDAVEEALVKAGVRQVAALKTAAVKADTLGRRPGKAAMPQRAVVKLGAPEPCAREVFVGEGLTL